MTTRADAFWGWALGAATALQAAGAVWLDRPGAGAAVQTLVVGAALGLLARELWRQRRRLPHRVDMLVVMLAFGGLGMLAGTALDRQLAGQPPGARTRMHTETAQAIPAATETLPPCCAGAAMEDPAATAPAAHRAGEHRAGARRPGAPSWARMRRALTSWMNILMLLAGVPPTWWLTRCAALATRDWRHWVSVHLAGNLGMVFGMILCGQTFGPALARALGHAPGMPETGHHLAMLAGMALGMLALELAAWGVLRRVGAMRGAS